MPRRSAGKKQVAYRLDTKLLDCIDSLQVIYPRFSATDIVDLMLKGFIAAHDVGSATGEEQLDRAVGQYLRGQLDIALEEAHEEYAVMARVIAREREQASDSAESVPSDPDL